MSYSSPIAAVVDGVPLSTAVREVPITSSNLENDFAAVSGAKASTPVDEVSYHPPSRPQHFNARELVGKLVV